MNFFLFSLLTVLISVTTIESFAIDKNLPSIATIVNNDGSLKTGNNGSYNLQGYEMKFSKTGSPLFFQTNFQNNKLNTELSLESWSELESMNGIVRALAVIGSNVYIGGTFVTAGNITARRIVQWNGTSWSALGQGMNGEVNALAVIGSTLYAGGNFSSAGDVQANHIAQWDGVNWSTLGNGIGMDLRIFSLTVNGTNLYAGGDFTTADGVPASRVAQYDGVNWSAIGSGVNNRVNALLFYAGNLYAAGDFTTAGGNSANRIAFWNGSVWSNMGTGMSGPGDHIYCLAVFGTHIYAGGFFSSAGGVSASNIARWEGSNWASLGDGMNDYVTAFAVSGGTLYAGGDFTTADGISVSKITKFDGTSWTPLGTGINNQVSAILFANSELYVGGGFSLAGGITAYNFAQWNGSNWFAPTQTIQAGSYSNLSLNNPSGFILSGNVSVSGTLTIGNGVVTLGSSNINASSFSGGSLLDGSINGFIETNGSGKATVTDLVNGSSVTIPVGNVTYSPVTITNTSGPTESFSVAVQNTVTNPPPGLADHVVSKQWNISEDVNGGNTANISVQWNTVDEGSSFNRNSTTLYLGHWNGVSYNSYPAVLSGANPWTATVTNISSFSPFIVGDDSALPIELSSFTSSITKNNVTLNWSTISEMNNSGFNIERKKVNSLEWMTVGNVAGRGNSNILNSYSFEDKYLETAIFNYRLKQIDFNGNHKYYDLANEVVIGVPKKFNLSQNYPNPFNPMTKINYELPFDSKVSIELYDMTGREVVNILNVTQPAGYYSIQFNGSSLASGIYFYRINAGQFVQTKRMVLVK